MRHSLVLAIILVTVGLTATARPGAAQGPTTSDAAAIYQARCAACHGARGEGTVIAPALNTPAVQAKSALAQIIAQGSANKRMPAFASVISQGEIEALARLIREFGASAPASESPAKEPAKGTASRSASLSLDLAPSAGGVVIARARAQDQEGRPIAGAQIEFRARTALGGVLPLAAATTDAQGQAEARLQLGEGRQVTLEAVFTDQKSLGPAAASAALEIPGVPQVEPLGNGLTSPTPPIELVALLGVLVGGVWATYGYVLYQLYRIRRGVRSSPR